MNTDEQYQGALDTSGAHASFSVRPLEGEGGIRLDCTLPIGRESARLLSEMIARLDEAGIGLHTIRRWTVGMGPGSFTGIRVGAAMINGICMGTGARVRGVPSSLALAAMFAEETLSTEGAAAAVSVAVLNDGRQQEMIVTRYSCRPDSVHAVAEPEVVPLRDAVDLAVDAILYLDDNTPACELEVAPNVQVWRRPHVAARYLMSTLISRPWSETEDDAGSRLEPVYVRPPVFIPPRDIPARST